MWLGLVTAQFAIRDILSNVQDKCGVSSDFITHL